MVLTEPDRKKIETDRKKIERLQTQLAQALASNSQQEEVEEVASNSQEDVASNCSYSQEEEEEEFYTCRCPAHLYKDESFYDTVIEPLTELSPPLNVNTGQILAQKILSVIVTRSKLPIKFEQVSGNDREVEINFLLQMANGNTETFTGFADFLCFHKLTRQQRQLCQTWTK